MWDKDDITSAGPMGHPASGEIGQGKEIGGREVNHRQNLPMSLGAERCSASERVCSTSGLQFPLGKVPARGRKPGDCIVPPVFPFGKLGPLESGGSQVASVVIQASSSRGLLRTGEGNRAAPGGVIFGMGC